MKLQYIIILLVVSLLTACHGNDFSISGEISDGNGKKLYLEHIGLSGIEVMDSVDLKSDGRFLFYAKRPRYPDLYQLRLENSKFVFPIDSTERINLYTDTKGLAYPSEIMGSHKAEILNKLRSSVRNLQLLYNNPESKNTSCFIDNYNEHREYADSIIMSDTRSIVSYYAIFQRIGNYYIYSPFVKADRVYCAAVATAFKAYMPDYERTSSLENWVLQALKEEKRNANIVSLQQMIDEADTAFLDITLPDQFGKEHKLSELKGKVVVLDFVSSAIQNRSAYILQLRELYNKYHSKGLEIYQVYVDEDAFRWSQTVENLPWVCVRETNMGRQSSLLTYNVRSIPTLFVINKQGDVIARHNDFKSIEKDINKSLK